MDEKTVKQIFAQYDLGNVGKVEKIEIGFTNELYSIDDRFILKIYTGHDGEKNFEKEVFFYEFFKNKIPVPKVVVADKTKKSCKNNFVIYRKIKGDNLYSKWHLFSDEERRKIVKQLCEILRKINESSIDEFVEKFKIDASFSWRNKVVDEIGVYLEKCKKRKTVSNDFTESIEIFVKENSHVLEKQKIGLVYWDAHFDNILIQDNKIVGILDFERTELGSVDFGLDIIKRMVDYPKKYMSEEFEEFAKKEDYKNLLKWFREFYPELFDFKNLGMRLKLYAVEHDLKTLLDWPNSKEVKEMIEKTIGYEAS